MKNSIQQIIIVVLLWLLCGCAVVENKFFDYTIGVERKLSGLKHKSIIVEKKPMYYLEREGAGDTIVLVHGFLADKDNWIRFVRKMPHDFRIIAPDLPAHGENFRDETISYTPQILARGMGKMLDTLKLKQFHLAGNSLGGWVAKCYTIENPERVVTLGLFNSMGLKANGTDGLTEAIIEGHNPFLIHTDEDFDNLQKAVFYKQPFLPWPIRPVLTRRFIDINFFYQRLMIELINELDYLTNNELVKGLTAANVPIFVLWGDRDPLLRVSLVPLYKKYFPKAETVIIKDCGHLPMIERPAESARHYVQFIRSHAHGS